MTINTVKFFYNGIKVNDEKSLVKIGVYGGKDNNGKISNDDIYIIYDWHWSSDFFLHRFRIFLNTLLNSLSIGMMMELVALRFRLKILFIRISSI